MIDHAVDPGKSPIHSVYREATDRKRRSIPDISLCCFEKLVTLVPLQAFLKLQSIQVNTMYC